jgi:hypothetical protein
MQKASDLDRLIRGLESTDQMLAVQDVKEVDSLEYTFVIDARFVTQFKDDGNEYLVRSQISIDPERRSIAFFSEIPTTIPPDRYGWALDMVNAIGIENPMLAPDARLEYDNEDDEEPVIMLISSWIVPLLAIEIGPGRHRPDAAVILRGLLARFCSETFEIVDALSEKQEEWELH